MKALKGGQTFIVILAGIALALAAFALEWLDYKNHIRSLPTQIYIFVLVAAFTVLGIWMGHALTKKPVLQTSEINEKAIKALGLTPRELAVLRELSRGHANKVIARRLGISPNTVKTHIKNLFEKLDVTSRMQAVGVARELGILWEG